MTGIFIIAAIALAIYIYWDHQNQQAVNSGRKNKAVNPTHLKRETKRLTPEENTIFRMIFQSLESLQIIYTTKKLDILKSRQDFCFKRLQELSYEIDNHNYAAICQTAINKYSEAYFDKALRDIFIQIVADPERYSNYDYYEDEIFFPNVARWIKSDFEDEIKKINGYKTKAAKQKRVDILKEKIADVYYHEASFMGTENKNYFDPRILLEQIDSLTSTPPAIAEAK